MTSKNSVKQEKKKGFFGELMEKLDKKLERKVQKTPCCSPDKDKGKGSSCC